MKWSEERIQHEKEVLVNQLETGCGRFAIFVLRTYAYIARECEKNNRNWCYASKVRGKSLINYVYNGPVDHMGCEVVEDAKDKLKKMGYIRYRKVDDQWLLYIEKEIDFCDLDQYVRDENEDKTDQNECEDFIEKVYQHLLHNGIKIYKYQKICWKCHKKMDVYTYFLGKQLEMEMGEEYIPGKDFIDTNDLFDITGVGAKHMELLDAYLSTLYPQIKIAYSKEMNQSYFMNCCPHCGKHQGINFTVYRPAELAYNQNLKELEVNVVDIRKAGIDKRIIENLYE